MKKNFVCECGRPATWVRHTQFSGSHYFCTIHAEKEEDFGKSDPSYFYWEKLPVNQIGKK